MEGKVVKLWWNTKKGRRAIMKIYDRSMRLGYVCKR